MKLALKAALLSIALLPLAGHVQAQPGSALNETSTDLTKHLGRSITLAGANPMMRRRGPSPFAALKLTDEQLEKLHVIRESHADNVMPKVADMMRLKRKQMELIASLSYDKQAVRDLQTKINSLSGELADERLTMIMESDGVLTGEQKKELRHTMLTHEPPMGPLGPMGPMDAMGPMGPMGPGMGPMGPSIGAPDSDCDWQPGGCSRREMK